MGDPWFAQLTEDLEQASPEFAQLWARHEVRDGLEERRELDHPDAGRLVLEMSAFQVAGNTDLRCCVYTAVPETDTAEKIRWLAEPTTIG